MNPQDGPAIPAPRHHQERDAIGSWGLPQDRVARIAARRAFVALKQTYLLALHAAQGPRADWLRHQVRQAEEPADLWLLRGLVFEQLPGAEGRADLQRGLEAVFPRRSPISGFQPLF